LEKTADVGREGNTVGGRLKTGVDKEKMKDDQGTFEKGERVPTFDEDVGPEVKTARDAEEAETN